VAQGDGTDALRASVAPGPLPVKRETALRVVAPLLEEPVANRGLTLSLGGPPGEDGSGASHVGLPEATYARSS
jgi:hypothetical protein